MTASHNRLDELLLVEATGRLTGDERAELEALLAGQEGVDRYAYERAASEFFLAVCAEPGATMPESVSKKLRLDAAQLLENLSQ